VVVGELAGGGGDSDMRVLEPALRQVQLLDLSAAGPFSGVAGVDEQIQTIENQQQ